MKKFFSRSVVTIALAVVLLVALSISAFADTFTYGYSGSACNTKLDTVTKTDESIFSKYVITREWYGGTSYYFGWHPVTDSFHHYNGYVDLHTTGNIEKVHTFKAAFSVAINKIFGASADYSFSYKTSRSVTQDINPDLASGWYYYGARARTRDMKYKETIKVYKRNNNMGWDYQETITTPPVYGCMLYSRQYYDWILDP